MAQPPFRSGVTLQDILDRPEFELSVVTAPQRAADSTVLGIHMTDVPQPEQWLADRWILLTAGLQVRGRPAQQRHLVQRLVGQGVAGLGYCVGIATRQVPKALIQEATRLDLPLFVVPYHIPVRIIIAEVNKMLLEAGDGLLNRSLATYDYLLAGFDSSLRTSAYPERQLVANLSSLLEIPVEHYNWMGRHDGTEYPLFDLGPDTFDGLSRHSVTKIARGTSSFLVCPCSISDHHTGWLVTRTPATPPHEAFAAAAMSATARLVALSVASRAHQPGVSRALREHLLDLLLDNAPSGERQNALGDPGEHARLSSLLAELGFLSGQQLHVMVCRPRHSAQAVPASWDRILDEAGVPYLIARSERAIIVLVQAPRERVAALLSTSRTLFGVAGPLRDVRDTRAAAEQASFALRCCAAGLIAPVENPYGGGYVAADDLPLSLWAAEHLGGCEGMVRARRLIEDLRRHPLAFEAVRAYLHHGQSIPATAAALHLHPNSLRSRLQSAERILGGPVRDPLVLTSVCLAFAAADAW